MRPATCSLWLSAGLVALSATGCYGPMNAPYGYPQQSYPAYGTPGTFQTLTPGGTYVPGGTYSPGTGGMYYSTPGAPGGSSLPNSNLPTPTYDNNSGGNAQPWGGGSNVPVPDPYYGNEFRPPVTGPQTAIPMPGTSTLARGPGLNNEFFRARPVSMEKAVADMPEAVSVKPTSSTTSTTVASSSPAPAPAAEAATALEGIVQFDSVSSRWKIAHRGASPESDGTSSNGEMTLAGSPLLQTLRSGEKVRLEGQVNHEERDAAGQPTFQAVRIIRDVAGR